MKKGFVIILLFLLFFGFWKLHSQDNAPIYSFFTAGHTYGSPLSPHYGLHYPFVDYIANINDYSGMELGFFTGDVVVHHTPDYWDSAQVDMDLLEMPIYIAAGNHDMGEEFLDRFGSYYSSFLLHDDLFIILTPGMNAWNISGPQLDFLTSVLDENASSVNNIFIVMHELIWWSPDNQYSVVDINYEPHYPGSTNFDEVVKPLLLSYTNPITIFAGDLGCTDKVTPYMYDHFDNITLIGSGMGGGKKDNIIITDIYEDSVHFKLVAINGDDPTALGELTDYSLFAAHEASSSSTIEFFPNPSRNIVAVKNAYSNDFEMTLYNSTGEKVLHQIIPKSSTEEINIQGFSAGMYQAKLSFKDAVINKKLIIY